MAFLFVLLAVVLSFQVAQARSGYVFAAPPQWLEMDPVPDASHAAPASDGTRYLMTVDQINLSGASPVWYRRVSYRVEAERGLAEAGQFTVDYQPDYQTLRLHSVDVWRDGIRGDRRSQIQVQDLRREADLESALFDGLHTLSVTIPDLRVGDRVDFSYSIAGANPVFGKHFDEVYGAAYSVPLALRRVKVIYPRTISLHWRVGNSAFHVEEGTVDNNRYVDITATRLRRVHEPDGTPDTFDPFGKIELSTSRDWGEVSTWATPLYAARFEDRDLAADLVRKLHLDRDDPHGALLRATAYVQGEIRYTGLDMGQNSHAPNRPEVTVERRFGDCKDKSLLLIALLHQLGIQAEPVLVNTVLGEAVAKRLPSAGAFDHVVTRAQIGGRTYWIDPTRDREVGTLEERTPLPFGKGLPICVDCGALVTIPRPMPLRPEVDVGQHIRLDEDGDRMSADFVVVTDYAPDHAVGIREDFDSQGNEEVGRQYVKYMRGFYDDIHGKGAPTVDERTSPHGLRTLERYRLDWTPGGEGTEFGIVFFQLLDWVPNLKEDTRNAPLAFTGPRFARQSIRTTFAGGWALPEEKVSVSNPFFDFHRTVEVSGNSLLIRAEWRRLSDEIPAKEYARFRKDIAEVRGLLQYDVSFDNGGSVSFSDPAAWSWPLLSLLALAGSLALLWRVRLRNRFAGALLAPGTIMPRVVHAPGMQTGALVLLIASAAASTAFDHGAEYAARPNRAHLFGIAASGIGMVLQMLVYAVLVRWSFRLLSQNVSYAGALKASVWGTAPQMILLLACAAIAVGGNLAVFAESQVPGAEHLPGIIVASLLLIAAVVWMVVGQLYAYSSLAGVSKRFAFGAICISILLALVILGPVALLFR